jgi:protoporphyrinogen oxidase
VSETIVLGAGVTGLAAGWSSGAPIYEAAAAPGGICASYYLRPGDRERLVAPPADGAAYRFEIGGGHWLFGGDPEVLDFLHGLTPLVRYERRASVYFANSGRCVPFPLQNHLDALDTDVADKVRAEKMTAFAQPVATLREWLLARFGPALCEHFFFPFHERYTAGLYAAIAPQDSYKSPVERTAPASDYNQAFLYPEAGLDALARALAARCEIHYRKRAVKIDSARREVHFADGARRGYQRLLTTLPLTQMLELADIAVPERAHPSSGVLVLTLGAERGPRCPDDHWLDVPDARAGFHRVGCYSNVDAGFLPRSDRAGRVAL